MSFGNIKNQISSYKDKFDGYKDKFNSVKDMFDNNKGKVDELLNSNKPTEKEKEKFEQSKHNNELVSLQNINVNDGKGNNNNVNIILIIDGKEAGVPSEDTVNYVLTKYLKSVIILKLFEFTFKPIFKIILELPISIIDMLSRSKNFKFQLEIDTSEYSMYSNDKSMMDLRGSTKFEKSINVFLIPFSLPQVKLSKSDRDKEKKESKKGSPSNYFEYPIEAFVMDHIRTGHTLISTNYRNQNLKNIIFDILNKNKNNCMPNINDIIICEPDNQNAIESVTIPPNTIYQSLVYLQKNFHIYNRQSIFYVDIDNKLYITKRGFMPSFNDNKNNVVKILIASKADLEGSHEFITDMFKNKGKDEKIFIAENEPFLEDNSASVATEYGSKTIIKNDTNTNGIVSMCLGFKEGTESNASVKYANGNSLVHEIYDGKERYINNNNSGPYSMQLDIDKAQSDSYFISIILKDINLKLFTPATYILIKFEDPKKRSFDGYYYIRDLYALYTKENTNVFSENMSSTIKLDLGRLFDDNGKLVV